ncbi:hypothetical protein HFX_6288 (plasmid) [Haloferax mediterranei ATCC 33500]|uniref:Uncharacterized protein n=1 Tax=Haloferax mediterranei (strain ATCC 33500 / DSM 1411 / JCM 8866 / NBRC 14739 / NCIMB 2177 / R-4) TaxID=523841 RepID=I3RB00_HALMT|nr:hypothetical protein HFX_6288 [Haloferax mediterranei ATCC 33500]
MGQNSRCYGEIKTTRQIISNSTWKTKSEILPNAKSELNDDEPGNRHEDDRPARSESVQVRERDASDTGDFAREDAVQQRVLVAPSQSRSSHDRDDEQRRDENDAHDSHRTDDDECGENRQKGVHRADVDPRCAGGRLVKRHVQKRPVGDRDSDDDDEAHRDEQPNVGPRDGRERAKEVLVDADRDAAVGE